MDFETLKIKVRDVSLDINSRSRNFIQIANEADELLCSDISVSDECLDFYIYILSTPEVFTKRGVYSFIDGFRYMQTLDKLSNQQKIRLIEVIAKYMPLYSEPNFYYSISTLLAQLNNCKVVDN